MPSARPLLSGGILAAVGILVALLAEVPATAQTDTLVSNTGQDAGAGSTGLHTTDQAQAFTTGAAANGYTLTGVDIRFGSVGSPTATTDAVPTARSAASRLSAVSHTSLWAVQLAPGRVRPGSAAGQAFPGVLVLHPQRMTSTGAAL